MRISDWSSDVCSSDLPEYRRAAMSDRRSVDIAKFNEIDDSWVQTGGLWTRCIFIGKAKSPDSPVGIAIKADREIGDRVAGKRSFGTTTIDRKSTRLNSSQ